MHTEALHCVGKHSGRAENLFRRFRGRQFLEARIIPKRIEHGIEPKQRGSERDAHSK
jgi:hypothetical protein